MRWVLAQTMRTGVTMTRQAAVPSWLDMAARYSSTSSEPFDAGEGDRLRELHGHEGLPAPAQAAGGFEVGAGLVDEQVEQLAVLLVLHDGVAGADHAEDVGPARHGVGADGGEVVGHLAGW